MHYEKHKRLGINKKKHEYGIINYNGSFKKKNNNYEEPQESVALTCPNQVMKEEEATKVLPV